MHLVRLELHDYRSYEQARMELGTGALVLLGENAQGKTNVLEAVHYLAVGHSHRVSGDAALVRAGAEAAVIRAAACLTGGRQIGIELELRSDGRNRARCNGQPQARVRDALGQVRSVLFAPEDLQLVRGDPSDRRRFLDDLLSQRRPAYAAARQEYARVLRQRNALLKGARRGRPRVPHPAGGEEETLEIWTQALVRAGANLLAARIAVVHKLAGPTQHSYSDLVASSAQPQTRVTLSYELSTGRRVQADPAHGVPDPAALAAELSDGLASVAAGERERGVTLAGPHRDELALTLNGLPAKGYASHGELWSLALALRLASREVLLEVGDEPIVLLDDVFAELDARRRDRLAARCSGFEQVIVTAAVDGDVPLAGPRHHVRAGTITPEEAA